MHAGATLCVGSEWHRYPSSFFVPSYVGEVRWIDDGFRGMLPIPFNSSLGGTAAAPHYFNDKNKASEEQYVSDLSLLTSLFVIIYCYSLEIRSDCSTALHCSFETLIGVLSSLSFILIGHTNIVEITCQLGRYWWNCYIFLCLFCFLYTDNHVGIVFVAAYCSIALPRQRAFTSKVPVVLHTILLAW